jgi:hypothetical protein
MYLVVNSDIQNGFRTYFNYVKNLAAFVDKQYGADPYERYANVYESTNPLVASIRPRPSPDAAKVKQYLKGALSNLHCLHLDATSDGFFEAKNAWTPVQGWYAVHNLLCALGCFISPGTDASHDRSCRNAAQLIAQRKLLPYPWSAYVEADFENKRPLFVHREFRKAPRPVSNLATPTLDSFEDHLANTLESTLDRRAKRRMRIAQTKNVGKGRTRRNLRPLEKKRIYKGAGPVTIFDALYRLRVRANYGNVDTFVEGCSNIREAQDFANALYVIVDASVTTLEALLKAYSGTRAYESVLLELSKRQTKELTVSVRTTYHISS